MAAEWLLCCALGVTLPADMTAKHNDRATLRLPAPSLRPGAVLSPLCRFLSSPSRQPSYTQACSHGQTCSEAGALEKSPDLLTAEGLCLPSSTTAGCF